MPPLTSLRSPLGVYYRSPLGVRDRVPLPDVLIVDYTLRYGLVRRDSGAEGGGVYGYAGPFEPRTGGFYYIATYRDGARYHADEGGRQGGPGNPYAGRCDRCTHYRAQRSHCVSIDSPVEPWWTGCCRWRSTTKPQGFFDL